jgi:uncharacterized protein (DUF1697 family)
MRYVALLRGINVTGKNMIKMETLRTTFVSLGFTNVASYINSGNIAFDTTKSAETKLVAKIEQAIETEFGLRVSVMVRSQTSIAGVLANNPFKGQYESHKQMNVLFLCEEIPAEKQGEILAMQTEQERLAIRGREIYLVLFCGFPESLIGRGLIERRLKIPITVRNWRTVEKLTEL